MSSFRMWEKQGYFHNTYREDNMSQKPDSKRPTDNQVTIEDVNRVLEVGRLLLSVLTEEELKNLQKVLNTSGNTSKIGNAGVT